MLLKVEQAIIRTLIYADVFDYPLTKEELWKYLISSSSIKNELFEQELKRSNDLDKKGKYYFLKDRRELVQKRMEREHESKRKMKIAKRAIRVLSKISSVEFIGISGALAMNNARHDDDIDLFIICLDKTIWITRILVLLFLEFMGLRRKRLQKNVSDTICVNMVITTSGLHLPGMKKDLYNAHEIVQMKPVFDRVGVYSKFRVMNKWVERYLPNSLDIKILRYYDIKRSLLYGFTLPAGRLVVILLRLLELPAKIVQLRSINRHRTTEVASDVLLAFHPLDYRNKILQEYKRRIKYYEI